MNVKLRMEEPPPVSASPRFHLRRIRSRKITAGNGDDEADTFRLLGEADSGVPWIESLWQRVQDAASGHRGNGSGNGCTIFKVPAEMRRQSPRLFQPSFVPIGPYHCGYGPRARDPQFAYAQAFKWRCLAHLLRRQPHVDPRDALDRCVEEIRALEAKARACYARAAEIDDNEYVEMLLLDASFLLHLILDGCSPQPDPDDFDDDWAEPAESPKLPASSWVRNRILLDLLLTENQIPFFVVQHLFFLLRTPREANVSLIASAVDLFADLHPRKSSAFSVTSNMKVHHLLHLFYLSILPCDGGGGGESSVERIMEARGRIARGVRLERREEGSHHLSFVDLRFRRGGAVEAPCLQLWDYSQVLFGNLVAFEQCYPEATGRVMAYVAFMDLVVNGRCRKGRTTEGEVEEVFPNMMRGGKKVGEFFDGLSAHVSVDCAAAYLMEMLEEGDRCSLWPRGRGPLLSLASAVGLVLALLVVVFAPKALLSRG